MSTPSRIRAQGVPEGRSSVDTDPGEARRRHSPLAWILLGFMWLYRLTSPLRSPRCRFYPSCSSYGVQAVKVHGAIRGGWLAIRRLGRCHPWNPGGVDHVPPRK